MRQLFDARAEKPVINALFIQPTYWCARNCNNCYVKQHIKTGPQIPVCEMIELFNGFYTKTLGECNQITISMDEIPPRGTEGYTWMMDFARALRWGWPGVQSECYPDSPEVHLTFKNPASYRKYEQTSITLPGRSLVSTITFSEIVEGDLPWIHSLKAHSPLLHVNYNHMSPAYLTNGSMNDHIKWINRVLEVVDSIYLIITKRPLGQERDLIQVGVDIKRMRHEFQYFKRLQRETMSPKLMVDGCVKDVVNFEQEGYGCSSSISRFQVWPDGSVSGCPYALKGDTSPASNALDIVKNIRKARDTYNFRMCYLPGVYRSLQEPNVP